MTTEVWNETAPWTRKFRFNVKVIIYLQPCMYLKFENVNIENEGATDENFLNLKCCISKWENRCRMNWPTDLPQHNITPFIGQPPTLPPEIPKIPKFYFHPGLSRGAHYVCFYKNFTNQTFTFIIIYQKKKKLLP